MDQPLRSANRAGCQIVVNKRDRLGRSIHHHSGQSKQLYARGIDLVQLDQSIDTISPSAGCSSKCLERLPCSSVPSGRRDFTTGSPLLGHAA
ncbi:hypothetical protein EH165_04805 [Nakamurella antarctica]|uniref:Resolvase/invertase-type recombinase catalytic domain-containing protein n=1 Tax=Nakamurella antarctica TaxID=1902245 RepID=A0A3G8ZK50_9ACTN|nr:hypothetical protein EH165_04805 [Nakamurella antarctica]